jgi:NAD+ synthase
VLRFEDADLSHRPEFIAKLLGWRPPRVAGRPAVTEAGSQPAIDQIPFDPAECLRRLAPTTASAIRELGRRGAVVAISGGIDSSVSAAICVRALGPEKVLCLRLPERDAGDASSHLGLALAESLGARTVEEPITAALEALGCYRRRDEAIRQVFPDYEPTWPNKLVRSAPSGGIIVFSIVIEHPDGSHEQRRMPTGPYRELLAAMNMKQRVRKLLEYTWADRLGYAVVGTPNLLEYDQGFFVKGGDGLADVKPIANLYKSQVYALARELDLPKSITEQAPTTDTFSLPQSQEEFYFGYPHEQMDLLMWGHASGLDPADLSSKVGLKPEQVEVAYREIERRRVATEYVHAPAIVLDPGP